MYLHFSIAESSARTKLVSVLEALAGVIQGQSLRFSLGSDTKLEDPNGGEYTCFESRYEANDVHLLLRVVPEAPTRDGVGYAFSLYMTGQGQKGTWILQATQGSWHPMPSPIRLQMTGLPVSIFPLLRAVLAEHEGVRDTTSDLEAAGPLVQILADGGHPDLALALANEALSQVPPGVQGGASLLEFVLRQSGMGAIGRRLRELPGRISGWEDARGAVPEGWTVEQIRRGIANLCPDDPVHWEGITEEAPPWFSHPHWPVAPPRKSPYGCSWWTAVLDAHHYAVDSGGNFIRALIRQNFERECEQVAQRPGVEGWSYRVERRALWLPDRRMPMMRVDLFAERILPSNGIRQQQTWTWISGPDAGDMALWVEQQQSGVKLFTLAFAWTAMGSADFRAQVQATWDRVVPYRWEAVSPELSLEPREDKNFSWFHGHESLDSKALAQVALQAADLSVSDRTEANALLGCECPPMRGFCPHGIALQTLIRAQRPTGSQPTQAERLRASARDQALQVVLHALGTSPSRERLLGVFRTFHARQQEVAALR